MSILEMPEEHVSMMLGGDLDMSIKLVLARFEADTMEDITYPACILSNGPAGAPGRE